MNFRKVLPLCLLGLFGLLWLLHPDQTASLPAPNQATSAVREEAAAPAGANAAAEFREWWGNFRGGKAPGETELRHGLELATVRKAGMLEWMATDPERALKEALPRAEYDQLPAVLKPHFEKHFNDTATLRVLPNCHPGATEDAVRFLESGGRSRIATVVGTRSGQTTKEDTLLAGITLQDRAVVRQEAFEQLSLEDARLLSGLRLGQAHEDRDFSSGSPLPAEPVTALAGGRRYLFADSASLSAFNERLGKLDQLPGPHGWASAFLAMPADGSSSGEGGFDWDGVEVPTRVLASAWTETPKKVFFIRVDFPDAPGASASQAELEAILNGPVATSLTDMSYGKTTIQGTVSTMVVRMPQPSSVYSAGEYSSQLHADARAAYQAIAGLTSLSSYDIVGIHFAFIGMKSGGALYSGLAGGSQQWIQGTLNNSVFIHEFGHNYGLLHASFWDTGNNSVVGPGTTEEYGDVFDIMGSGADLPYHYGPFEKALLSWLGTEKIAYVPTAAASGIQRIYRFDHPQTTGAKRGIRATRTLGGSDFYWIGYRAGVPGNNYLPNGIYLTWQQTDTAKTWLVDTTPGSLAGKNDCAVPIGTTYADPGGQLFITPLAKGGSGADAWLDVNVQLGNFAGNGAPTVSISAPAALSARGPTQFTTTVNDPDGDPLFYLWDFGDGTPSVNQQNPEHTYSVGGNYTVKVTVNDMRGHSTTATKAITIADPLATWTKQLTSPVEVVYTSSYLGGRFLAASQSGGATNMRYSLDGINWEYIPSIGNFHPAEMAYDGHWFVLVGGLASEYAHALRSPDGKNWFNSSVPPFLEGPVNSIACGGDVFVAGGDRGLMMRSTDGAATWSTVTLPGMDSNTRLTDIAYGNGLFVATAYQLPSLTPALFTSPDGLNWTQSATALPAAINLVRFDQGVFYAGSSNGFLRSVDGINWSAMPVAGGVSTSVSSLTASPGFLLASGVEGSSKYFYVSEDRLTWTKSLKPSVGIDELWPIYGDGKFICSFSSRFYRSGSLYPANQAPVVSVAAPSTATAQQSISFRATCSDPDGDPLLLLWDFNDGTPVQEGAGCYHRFLSVGTFQVKFSAIDRRGGVTTVTTPVTVSDPTFGWTLRAGGPNYGIALESIAAGNGLVVAVSSGASAACVVSSDGATWNYFSSAQSNGPRFSGVEFDGTQFFATALEGGLGAIYTSANGSAWTRRYLGGPALKDIAWRPGRYVAVGVDGTIVYSTNGTTWTAANSGINNTDFQSVACNDQGFVVVGGNTSWSSGRSNRPFILTSPDGIVWTETTGNSTAQIGNANFLTKVCYCRDRFLAASWSSDLLRSLNNGASFSGSGFINWSPGQGFAYGNGIFLACAYAGDPTKPINLLSLDGENWAPQTIPAQSERTDAIFFNNTFITVGPKEIWQSAPVIAPLGGYDSWRSARFPESPPLSGAEDDFDGDGIPNLAEYGTGSDPRNSLDRPAITSVMANQHLVVTIPKMTGLEDLACTAEYSTDLLGWTSNGVIVVEDSATRLVVKVPVQGKRGFLRPVFTLK